MQTHSSPVRPISDAPYTGRVMQRTGSDGTTPMDICPAPKDLPSDYIINGYRLLHSIGEGGFGVTYLAADELLHRRVVIKEHFPHSLCQRRATTFDVTYHNHVSEQEYHWAMGNFLREVRLLASLDHPHIVKIYTFFEAHNTAYYVTEHIDGPSLADVAVEYRKHLGHIPQQPLYSLMVRMLDALDYLHSRNILHLDIKPDNILVTRDGRPVLIDMGAAIDLSEEMPSTFVETPGYSPPEQCTPGSKLTPATDLYSFAATLYYLITGNAVLPSRQRELIDTLAPLSSMPNLTTKYHPQLLAGIDKALSPAIKDRYASAAEWLYDLSPHS